jgi:hypothetical protein
VSANLDKSSQQRDLVLAIVAFMIALALWQMQGLFFLTYPFRLFVTMIHELGHGLTAILTGGDFLHFEITDRGAGLAYTRGGSRFFVIQAGYIGTALFGAALLFLTHRVRKPGRVAMGVGVFIGILTLAYSGISLRNISVIETILVGATLAGAGWLILTRATDEGRYAGLAVGALGALLLVGFAGNQNVLTIFVGLISALVLVYIGLRASRDVIVVVLTFLAFLTGLQAITDAWVLFQIVSLSAALMPANDASAMARDVGGPAAMWALIWIVMDIALLGATIYITLIRPQRHAS